MTAKQLLEKRDILNITHKNCFDGAMANMVLRLHADNEDINVDTLALDYSDINKKVLEDILDKAKDKHVFLTDFSLPKDYIYAIKQEAFSVYIIDHHKTAEAMLKDIPDNMKTFDMSKSGCVLAWEYFFPNNEVPKLLLHVQDRDIWKWELKNSEIINSGLRIYDTDELLNLDIPGIKRMFKHSYLEGLYIAGVSINKYNNTRVNNIVNNHSETILYNIGGVDMPCLNNAELISDVGNVLASNSKSNMSAQWFIIEDKIIFSFRSIGDADVSEIAKTFGGGGHKNAAGCNISLDKINLNKFLSKRILSISDIKENR